MQNNWKIFTFVLSNVQTFFLASISYLVQCNYLCNIYIGLSIIGKDDLKYTGGCAHVINKNYAILFKTLEYCEFLYSLWVQELIPFIYQGTIINSKYTLFD
jgi:hypothetical protein